MSVEPGWYPDPEDRSRARYWDGSTWTDETRELEGFEGRDAGTEPPPPPSPPPAAAGTPDGAGWWRRPWLWAAAIAVVAVGAAGFVVLTGTDDAGAEVILEPARAEGEDPFTDSVSRARVEVESGGVEPVSGGDASVEAVRGSAPQLYGGTGRRAACDAEALMRFLDRNPAKARAFAGVVGVRPDRLRSYISALTPVVLREDTRVTNHGFAGGRARPAQAVLQAGSAVMVDDRGVPRVRCACGNPLAEPAAVSSSPRFTGRRWEGFDERRLVAVRESRRRIDSFELVDVRTGRPYTQGVGVGDVRDLVFAFGGVGNLRIGMTESQARAATRMRVDFGDPVNSLSPCRGVSFPAMADSLSGLAVNGRTIGALYSSSPRARTLAGIRVGSTETEIERAYPGRVTRSPGLGAGYEFLRVTAPGGDRDTLQFVTDASDRVTALGVGRPPDILEPEGCL